MLTMKHARLTLVLFVSCLISVTTAQTAKNVVSKKPDYEQPEDIPQRQATRLSMVKEAAISYAMRVALAEESEKINAIVKENERQLDEVYDFGSLMIRGNIIPPVIQRADSVSETNQDELLQYTGRVFKIKRQPRFATRAPTWRTYLLQPTFVLVTKPPAGLLPQNDKEKIAWAQGVVIGWEAGASQAHAIFLRNSYRLQSDFLGMINYHLLLKANMVTEPIVTTTSKALSGDNASLNIDQVNYKIEAKPVFNPNMNSWIPYISTPDESHTMTMALQAANKPTATRNVQNIRSTRDELLNMQFAK